MNRNTRNTLSEIIISIDEMSKKIKIAKAVLSKEFDELPDKIKMGGESNFLDFQIGELGHAIDSLEDVRHYLKETGI